MARARVLVVEDSALLLGLIEAVLAKQDLEIVGPAGTLEEAYALADSAAFDFAMLDINLDGEMIFPAAERLLERGIPFVFCSGYTPGDLIPPGMREVPLLGKPYALPALVKMTERMLGAVPTPPANP